MDNRAKLAARGGGCWFEYPEVDKDWMTNSHRLAESEVPDDARNAPWSYKDSYAEIPSGDWADRRNGELPPRVPARDNGRPEAGAQSA